jgi:hypothetical protein
VGWCGESSGGSVIGSSVGGPGDGVAQSNLAYSIGATTAALVTVTAPERVGRCGESSGGSVIGSSVGGPGDGVAQSNLAYSIGATTAALVAVTAPERVGWG